MTNINELLVHVVDDDEAIRGSISFMLSTAGYTVQTYRSGAEVLSLARKLEPGCILLDVRMPGMDGLETHQALRRRGIQFPVVIMTGHGDVSLAVKAMKAGAIDFIEKPFESSTLISAVDEALARLNGGGNSDDRAQAARSRLETLSAREREILDGLTNGLPNKSIAHELGISPRTVEVHRANVMTKLEVRSLSEALRIAFAAKGSF